MKEKILALIRECYPDGAFIPTFYYEDHADAFYSYESSNENYLFLGVGVSLEEARQIAEKWLEESKNIWRVRDTVQKWEWRETSDGGEFLLPSHLRCRENGLHNRRVNASTIQIGKVNDYCELAHMILRI